MSGVELTSSIGTVDVENLVLRLPAHGNWVATMDIGQPTAPTVGTPATLKLARSTGVIDTFAGTVRRAQVTPGTQNLSVTIVGGSGRLLTEIPPRHHTAGAQTVPAGLVLAGIAQAALERLATGVEVSIDAFQFQRYTRVRGEPWAALDVLASVLGPDIEWRVLADGTLWMGRETWPVVDAKQFYWKGDPRDGAVLYVPDGAPYRPGTTIDGARVVECCYRVTPGRPVMEARVRVPGDPVVQPPLAPYARSYVATVVSQNADLTLNLVASDPVLGNDLRNVPFKLGIPGTKVVVPTNAVVRLSFESGLPTGAFAGDIDLDPTPTHRFALVGDNVAIGNLSGIANLMTGAVTFTYSPANGGPPVVDVEVSLAGNVDGPGHKYAFGTRAPS